MPRLRMRLAGIVCACLAVLALAACGGAGSATSRASATPSASPASTSGTRATPPATPSPTRLGGPPAAPQNLTFAGDLRGTMTALAAQSSQTPSACTERPVQSAAWASTLYGSVDGAVYGFLATVKPYNGPGTYGAARSQIQVFSVSDRQRTWESLPGDSVSFTVDNGNLTGSVEATLTNLSSNEPTLKVTGTWSCAP